MSVPVPENRTRTRRCGAVAGGGAQAGRSRRGTTVCDRRRRCGNPDAPGPCRITRAPSPATTCPSWRDVSPHGATAPSWCAPIACDSAGGGLSCGAAKPGARGQLKCAIAASGGRAGYAGAAGGRGVARRFAVAGFSAESREANRRARHRKHFRASTGRKTFRQMESGCRAGEARRVPLCVRRLVATALFFFADVAIGRALRPFLSLPGRGGFVLVTGFLLSHLGPVKPFELEAHGHLLHAAGVET